MNPEIFREYDIRGVAELDLTDEAVTTLGRGIGAYLQRHGCLRITLGRDCRLSSPRLRDHLAAGLCSTGLQIVDIGVCPSPLLYYSLHRLQPDGGVMITGSHNPSEYNGFKVALGKATIYGQEIQEIWRIIQAGSFPQVEGRIEQAAIASDYLRELKQAFGVLPHPPRVVLDAGNGTASDLAPELYRAMGCEVIPLYCTMDGTFPNHHPDPTVVKNLQDLIRTVRDEGADVGIAFDGDGDRIGAVDDQGNIIWGDQLMILYGRDILQDRPGATIIADVKSSMNLYEQIAKHGGRGIMWRTGHSLIKAKMKEEKAAFAGEMSGHMFFADRYYGYDDAVYAGARLLEIISKTRRSVSEMLADVPKMYATPEIRVDCADSVKFSVVKKIQDLFKRDHQTVTVDGLRVVFEDGWGLIRASNTQPVLVLRFEARTPERLAEIQTLIEGKLAEVRGRT
jgi:phosphomannomutase/phosphoglucomutase